MNWAFITTCLYKKVLCPETYFQSPPFIKMLKALTFKKKKKILKALRNATQLLIHLDKKEITKKTKERKRNTC